MQSGGCAKAFDPRGKAFMGLPPFLYCPCLLRVNLCGKMRAMISGAEQLAGRDIKGVICDLMCTLFNPGMQEEAVKKWAVASGLSARAAAQALSQIELEAGVGRPALFEDWMRQVLDEAGRESAIDVQQARVAAHRLGVLTASQGRLYPHVRELLTELKKFYRVGILSTVSHRGRLAAKNLGLDEPWIHAAAFSSEVHVMKPDPRAYEIIAERLKVPLRQCLFVDDHIEYVRAAKELGMVSVTVLHAEGHTAEFVRSGELTREDITAEGITVINRIAELGDLLQIPYWVTPSEDGADDDDQTNGWLAEANVI